MTFNWRDHIRIEPQQRDLDTLSPHARVAIDARLEQYAVLERMLDQVSLIPKVQLMMEQAHSLSPIRRAEMNQMYSGEFPPTDDTRVEIIISNSAQGAEFALETNSIKIDPADIVSLNYKTENGLAEMSLQRAFLHELGHAADEKLTPYYDLQQKQDAAKETVDAFLQDFPEFSNEYETSQTIARLSVDEWINAPNTEIFMEYYDKIVGGSRLSIPENESLAESATKYAQILSGTENNSNNRTELASTYLQVGYDRAIARKNETKDELPIILQNNEIMGEYFSEPDRSKYKPKEKTPPALNETALTPQYYGAVTDELKKRTNASLNKDRTLSPTSLCSQEVIDQLSCDAATIDFDGVDVNETASPTPPTAPNKSTPTTARQH